MSELTEDNLIRLHFCHMPELADKIILSLQIKQRVEQEIKEREEQVSNRTDDEIGDFKFLIHILKLIRYGDNYD